MLLGLLIDLGASHQGCVVTPQLETGVLIARYSQNDRVPKLEGPTLRQKLPGDRGSKRTLPRLLCGYHAGRVLVLRLRGAWYRMSLTLPSSYDVYSMPGGQAAGEVIDATRVGSLQLAQ